MYMLCNLNEDLLTANRLEQILNNLSLFQLIREPTRVTPKSKTLIYIDVIITNNGDTILQAETSLSIDDHHVVSCTINLRKQRMKPIKTYDRNYANNSPENFQILLMQLSNHLNLMHEADGVNTQVQILTDNFLLALDSCAPFNEKLMKRPPARWITAAIKTEIKKKYIS